ncbi:DNA mismatch repair endonuclease MutL [Acetatifactor aquisgranensis]|uniref:DNA mismatch repair endonuclease MutL n=1 Tax=Acetatifactor aquisgranensis TaxID=2941233 RepID=UPI0020401FF6|nr:DNA mismatch repair endonuclease MutL [Acetatifactor aquisgranensis]
MSQIHILDSETIDKIAAGEVVERPSSVVKELVENAIDAGAGAVTVEAKDGGIEFIRVTDNGCGMEGSQLRTAFLRHATSKIEDAGDLMRISSLGFRGEALSSIAAVAKVEVITTPAGSIMGNRILLEGARETGFEEVGAPEGTTFLVRNLFFNTPVRRKFLKQPATEGGYIVDLMEHLALSRPDVSFKLVMGGQMKFHTSGNGDLKEVIYRIYGRDAANELVPIQAEKNGVKVEGYLGKPVQVRSNRNFEIYFINGRFIRSNVLSRAIEEGYKEYLMQHKFPFCVLHITMDTGRVDVNVHPTKMDVRFDDAIGFSSFLTEAVKGALRSREMIPQATLSTERELKEARKAEREEKAEGRSREKQAAPEPFEHRRGDAYRVMEETRYAAEKPGKQEFIHNPVWERVRNGRADNDSGMPSAVPVSGDTERMAVAGKSAGSAGEILSDIPMPKEIQAAEAEEEEPFFTETSELSEEEEHSAQQILPAQKTEAMNQPEEQPAFQEGNANRPEEQPWFREGEASRPEEQPSLREGEANRPEEQPLLQERDAKQSAEQSLRPEAGMKYAAEQAPLQEAYSGEQMNLFEEKILTMENRSRFRIIGQVFDTYWLIEFEDKLMMIDQHAAHEKVNYERLMKRYHEKNVLSQGLMPPVIVSLSGQEESVLKNHLDTFAALGFEIEAFGGSEYALRSVPVDLYGCDEREMFLEVLDSLLYGTGFGSIRVIEEKIASMSCKAAVKGNNKLSVPEAEALIDELLTLDNPYNCPHGRPTIVTISKTEMERKFKRIVN